MIKKVIVVGSINYDIVASAERLPKRGETVTGYSVDSFIGGKGSNQSVQMSLLGLSTTLVAQIGKDQQGSIVLEGLKSKHVNTSYISQVESSRTGCAVIFVSPDGSNMLVDAHGANHKMSLQTIDKATSAIAEADLYVTQNEINVDALLHGLKIACKAKIPTLLNPAPALPLPEEIFPLLDYIAPNETEAELYTSVQKDGLTDEEWRRKNAQWFLDRGVRNVCITLGEKGSYFYNGIEEIYSPPFAVTPIDTTAAGDSFIGGFVYGVISKWNYSEILKFANGCGALSTTIMGAQNSIQDIESIKNFIANNH
jgi:ribokinase